MIDTGKYWDGLSQYEKWLLVKKYRFWEGLIDFPLRWIPEDLKEKIGREIAEKQP